MVGKGLTVTITEFDAILKPSFTVTLYVVVTVGFTVGFCKVEVNPEGDDVQLYEIETALFPPEAVALNWTVVPILQITWGVADTATAKAVPFKVTTIWSLLVQPLLSVTVSVKVVGLVYKFVVLTISVVLGGTIFPEGDHK
jgi:hypothetical protein